MASSQETLNGQTEPSKESNGRPLTGDEVVISGMSGIFPSSDNVVQFMDNLYNKVDMVTSEDPRWVFNHPEVPKHLGKVNGMGKFDAQFFRVHYKQACTMEPMSRKLLEHAYSAIYDSGINPLQLRGRKVGVFIGSTFSESEKNVIYETIQRNGFGITGCNKAMYANRISYWIDGKGPSYALDLACASSMACLEHAYRSISTGQCDAAIVGGCNLCMHPNVSLNLKRAGFLCLDGKTKCFDKNGDGYVRSDAISVLFLQKAKDAKRIYSEVYYAKGNYSLRPDAEFLPIRESKDIKEFLEAFYADIDVSPEDVEYVEACGSAIAEADGNELEAIGKVFANQKPIRIGSVKSNMGHSEPASGVCALTKVCLAYHKGKLPANLHYYEPQDHISSIRDGRVQVLLEHEPFNRGYTALNSFSYTGANIHVLLKGRYKPKDLERYKSSIPHIVLVSGRQESCVNKILDLLKNRPLDPEQVALLHSIHESDIPGHMCRGYTILDTNERKETVSLSQSMEYCPGYTRPLWFVYSGMGSQWAGMGSELMRIPTFAAAIERCRNVLEPKGVDIIKILTEPDKTIYDNILNSFVGIAAVQIGLTDILREIGIVPDNIIGHSVGELGCAYADGCFTAEEMILSAYSRGLVSVQTPFIRGSMAAVGLGYKAVLPFCPPQIEVACHNSSESSTISGPVDVMKEFVAELTKRGVFAKEVPCSNIAYHSRYIASAGPGLQKYLSEVITDPKPRSDKWISTSVPQDKWDDPVAKFSSAEYHTNNLLNPVLFEEASKKIPSNALVIEIAPHGLLQAILKRSLSECTHIPLTRRGHSDPVKFLLEAIGKLYQAGLNPKVDILYPKIEYPVATETPLLSHFVEWEHSENWPQAKYNTKDRVTAAIRKFVMSIHDDDYKYFSGHVKDGACVVPEAALLVLIWETLAMQMGVDYRELSVIFHDVQFHSEANITAEVPLKLGIMIHKGNHQFEVNFDDTQIVSGYVNEVRNSNIQYRNLDELQTKDKEIILTATDIYKIMYQRGYSYKYPFQSIHSSNIERNKAIIKWSDEWVTFLDSLIQFNAFAKNHNGISVPKLIKKLTINVKEHDKTKKIECDDFIAYEAQLYDIFQITRCAGVELDGIIYTDKAKPEHIPNMLDTKTFVPHFIKGDVDITTVLQINLQILIDNVVDKNIKITQIISHSDETNITNILEKISNSIIITTDVNSIDISNVKLDSVLNRDKHINDSNMFIMNNLLGDEKTMKTFYDILPKNAFILTMEQDTTKIHTKYKLFDVVTVMSNQRLIFIMFKRTNLAENIIYMPITHDNTFSWIPRLRNELLKTRRVILISERQSYDGLLGLVKSIRQKHGYNIGLVVIDDYHAPSFDPEHDFFKEQLQKDLSYNILYKNQWGGYYYIPSEKSINLRNVTLTTTEQGIDNVTWTEGQAFRDSNNLIKVYYAAASFKDTEKAARNIKEGDTSFGMDFSGIDSRDERVMGLVSGGAIASTVKADQHLLWPVPKHWTLEDAATVPLPYVLAYYCLGVRSELRRGSIVFVNGGAGALGQAIISVCLSNDCTVYTAVSDLRKKRFLLKLFPKLNENNIGNSRDITFQNMVIHNSKNKRCDIVVNCVSGEMRKAAMGCVGFSGIFLDVSNYDTFENKKFGMYYLNELKHYVNVQVSTLFRPEYSHEKKAIQFMISDGIAKGAVRPISRVIYLPEDVSRAFRLLSTCRHRGRVLIRMKDPVSLDQNINVIPRMSYSSNGTYIIVCDEKELGIELVDRMVRKSARNIIIHLRQNFVTSYFFTKFSTWKKLGATVKLISDSLKTERACMSLINEGKKLGPIYGIFVIQDTKLRINGEIFEQKDFIEKFNNMPLIIANLDIVSRKSCPELRHFVVLGCSSSNASDEYAFATSEKICQTRNGIGLPALVLRIESLNLFQFDKNEEEISQSKVQPQTVSAVFNALETSLKLKYNNVVSFDVKERTNSDFLRKIANILGFENVNSLDENLTLEELSVNEINVEEIKAVIKESYQMNYPNEKIQKMSILSLKEIGSNSNMQRTRFDSGFGAFYTFIDEDECMATEPMVSMPTKLSNATEKEEELDPKATYLMLIPGFEGHHQIFTQVCERLKVQAMTFQLGPDLTNDSIQQMAVNIMTFMKKRFELKSKFYLIGYSFGVNVALELAALMETQGHVGIVHCLDSSPDALRVQMDAYLGNLTDAQLQNTIVEHMYRLMTGQDSSELKIDLENTDSWSEKVEACVNRLRGLVNYSHQYKRSLLQSAYNRIKLAREYKPDFKLESEIVLMKCIPHPRAKALADDYNLSKYTKRPVQVFDLKSDHALAPYDCRVSNIVNRLFDAGVLEEFKKKNLCETYLADPFKIL